MGPRPSLKHSIDRICNEGDYAPENCRWATTAEQSRNRRNTRLYTYQGRAQVLVDWAADLGVNVNTLRGRLEGGWSVERAFSTPLLRPRYP